MNIKCKHCGMDYEVDKSYTGEKVDCPECGKGFIIAPETSSVSDFEDGILILGLYQMQGEVAKGGMGKVYRVHHTSWNVDLAMKQPHPHMFDTQDKKDNFSRECDAWINLGLHPHIVSCHYVREIDGTPSIFAEWMDGGDLLCCIQDGKIDSLEKILDIAIQFAWGLDYAHKQGLIHQDVKPENVMLDLEGNVKVTDFGIANAKRDLAISVSTTSKLDGTIISESGAYTPAYCSPEQVNKGKLTKRTDIWSWAVSVMEMFVGERLWQSGVVAGMACNDYFESAGINIPECVKNLLKTCFTEDEAKRPHDFKVIVAKLLEIYRMETGKDYKRAEPASAADDPDSLNNHALSYMDIGKPKRAQSLWKQALQIDPQHLESTYNQGRYLWLSAEIDDLNLIRRMESIRYSYGGSWRDEYLLAMIHLDRCDAKSALSLLENAVTQSDNDPDVIKLIKTAKSLSGKGECIHSLKGHTKDVKCVGFSPDGKYAISGGADKTIKLWKVKNGECFHTLDGHIKPVCSVDFSPDGKLVISGSFDKTLKLWDVKSGECLRTFAGHKNWVNSVRFSPDGKSALSGSNDHTMKLWDVKSGECLHTFEGHDKWVVFVGFSSDGKSALSGSSDRMMKLWDIAGGQCIQTFEARENEIDFADFSADGKFALSGNENGSLKLWNVKRDKSLRIFEGHAKLVCSADFSPDGKFILSGSEDKTIKLWNVKNTQCLRSFENHIKDVRSVKFSPDGRFFLSGGLDKTVNLWSMPVVKLYSDWELCKIRSTVESLKLEQRFKTAFAKAERKSNNGNIVEALTTLDAARTIMGFERIPQSLELNQQLGKSCLISAFRGGWVEKSFQDKISIYSVAVNQDNKFALSGSIDRTMKLWDMKTGQCIRTFEGHSKGVNSVCFSPDGKYALSGSRDKTLKLWNVKRGYCLRTFEGHTDIVSFVTFSPNKKYVLSGSRDKTLKLWRLENNRCVRTFEGHAGMVSSVSFSPDGRYVLSGSWDKLVKVWNVSDGLCIHTFEGHANSVTSVCFSPDGKYAISGGADKTIKLWNIKNGECLCTFEGHTDVVNSVCFSPDGKYILSGSNDVSLRLWDTASGQCLRTFEGHMGDVISVSFSSGGNFALSGSRDKTMKLWRLDWEYEFPGWANWDIEAEPYLRNFLIIKNGLWNEDDFNDLINDLRNRGYGWLRPEGVRSKLEKMTFIHENENY